MLYHVSLEKIKRNILIPRIPKQRIEGEDGKIKRICFCDSIEGCLSAMPAGIQIAKNLAFLYRYTKIAPLLYVYTVDESHILPGNLIFPEKVVEHVVDASLTGEHWVINQNVQCQESLIGLTNIKHEYVEVPDKPVKIDYVSHIDYIRYNNIPDNRPEVFFKDLIKTYSLRSILCTIDFKTFFDKKKRGVKNDENNNESEASQVG
jgi:hypothetical protein